MGRELKRKQAKREGKNVKNITTNNKHRIRQTRRI